MGIISGCILTITCENASNDTIVWMVIAERKDSFITPLDIYTFGHLKCPKAERIAPDKTPTSRRFNWQKV